MTAASEFDGSIYAKEHRHGPPECDDDPAAVLAFGLIQYNIGDHAIAHDDEQGSTDEFTDKWRHKQSV